MLKKGIIIAVVAVIAVTVGIFFGKGGFGGDKGNGKGDGNTSQVMIEDDDTEKSEPVTEELLYLELKINENEYIYNNNKYSIEDMELLINEIKEEDKLSVKLVDEEASEKAYDFVKNALKENNIKFIEE